MKKILSALLATAALGATTIVASAEELSYELMGIKGTLTDVVTADGYDTFSQITVANDLFKTVNVYYYVEGGELEYFTMELHIPEGYTLDDLNAAFGYAFTEDDVTVIDDNTYSVNEEALPILIGYDGTAYDAHQFSVDMINAINSSGDDFFEDLLGGDGDTPADDVVEDTDTSDDVTEDTSDDAAGDTSTDDSDTTGDNKGSADTGIPGVAAAAGIAVAAAGALLISKKRS